MTRLDQRTLNDAIDACLALQTEDYYVPSDVAREVIARYESLVDGVSKRLVFERITDMVRRRMKSALKSALRDEESTQLQLFLPEELARIRLPKNFSLLVATGEMEDSEDTEGTEEEKCQWVPFPKATFRDLEQHLRLLDRGIARDLAKREDMRILHSYLRPLMKGREDEAFAPLLRQIAESQRAARETAERLKAA
jgi:hypothetical protein